MTELKTKKIKKILRKSKITREQLRIWRRLNVRRKEYNICQDCFDKMIQMLEEDLK